MLSSRRGRGILCGFIFLLSAVSARSPEANELGGMQSGLVKGPAADGALEWVIAPQAQTMTAEVAVPEPAPSAIRPMLSAPVNRAPAGMPRWATPARFFTINEVLAKRQRAASLSHPVQLAAVDPGTTVTDTPAIRTSPVRSGEPFGLFTFRAPEGHLWLKWRKVEAEIQGEPPALALCRDQPGHCTPATARFVAIIREAAGRQGRAKLELVNERINAAIRYTTDIAQWSAPDVWSAPLDRRGEGSMETGMGDCEDYAIAKYVVLRQSGVAAGDLRLILVRDNSVGLAHAVLAAREEERWLILDNRWNRLVEDVELRQFVPLFALSDQGVQLFAAPYASKQPAAAERSTMNDGSQSISVGTDVPAAVRDRLSGAGRLGSLPFLM